MNININKDFEREYKDDSFRGFSMKEALCIGCALCVAAVTSIFLYYRFQIPLNLVLYAGLPPAVPFLFFGFYRYQDLSAAAFLKELFFERRTRVLSYSAGEYAVKDKEPADKKEERQAQKKKRAQKRAYRKKLWERRKQ